MRVVVASVDYRARPHYGSWLARAFKRLGCEVATVSGGEHMDSAPNGYTDPVWVAPSARFGSRVGVGEVQSRVGPVDLAVMVDCGNDFAMVNDGSAPYAYVWRETNCGSEAERVMRSAGGAVVHHCMLGKGKFDSAEWEQMRYLPFAVDREVFSKCLSYENREFGFVYTGRERGNGTWATLNNVLNALDAGPVVCRDYVDGYAGYADLLSVSRATYAVDTGRYVGSRALEAMAVGQAVFVDGGPAFDRMGVEYERDCFQIDTQLCRETGEYVLTGNALEKIASVLRDYDRWTYVSRNARAAILNAHTYEHRAQEIATAAGVKLPKTVEECESFSHL